MGAALAGVVVDTMVVSWLFDERPNPLAERYRDLIGPASVLLAFQTVMELRSCAEKCAPVRPSARSYEVGWVNQGSAVDAHGRAVLPGAHPDGVLVEARTGALQ